MFVSDSVTDVSVSYRHVRIRLSYRHVRILQTYPYPTRLQTCPYVCKIPVSDMSLKLWTYIIVLIYIIYIYNRCIYTHTHTHTHSHSHTHTLTLTRTPTPTLSHTPKSLSQCEQVTDATLTGMSALCHLQVLLLAHTQVSSPLFFVSPFFFLPVLSVGGGHFFRH